jgi:hypothetical protein
MSFASPCSGLPFDRPIAYIAAAARDPCQSNDEAISKWTERRGIAPIGELQTPDEYDTAGI